MITDDYDPTSGYAIRLRDAEVGGLVASPQNPVEPKKPRGRPRGSTNKIGANGKALIDKEGLGGIRMLCRMANFRPVYKALKGGGREQVEYTVADAVAAAKFIGSRLVPELKAQELTGANGKDLLPLQVNITQWDAGIAGRPENVSPEDWDASLAAGSPVRHTLTRRTGEPADADRACPESWTADDANAAGDSPRGSQHHSNAARLAGAGDVQQDALAHAAPPASLPAGLDHPRPRTYRQGESVPVAGGKAFVLVGETLTDGRQKYWLCRADGERLSAHFSMVDATFKAEMLIEQGKI